MRLFRSSSIQTHFRSWVVSLYKNARSRDIEQIVSVLVQDSNSNPAEGFTFCFIYSVGVRIAVRCNYLTYYVHKTPVPFGPNRLRDTDHVLYNMRCAGERHRASADDRSRHRGDEGIRRNCSDGIQDGHRALFQQWLVADHCHPT